MYCSSSPAFSVAEYREAAIHAIFAGSSLRMLGFWAGTNLKPKKKCMSGGGSRQPTEMQPAKKRPSSKRPPRGRPFGVSIPWHVADFELAFELSLLQNCVFLSG